MMLNFILFFNLLIILILILIPSYKIHLLKLFSLYSSFLIFILSLFLWLNYNYNLSIFQFSAFNFWINTFNFTYILGIDSISLFFILLTTFLIPLCILINWNIIKFRLKEFLIILFIIEFLLINVFSVLNLILFYLFFEGILIPMFLIIGIWGSRQQKIYAAYQFFIYTLFGSVLMLLAIIIIYFHTGTSDIYLLLNTTFSKSRQEILWLAFFLSFAIKVPMIPVHIWLPQAHVEAPTTGSVILAAILLKLGTYGFLRFSIPMFPYASNYFMPLIYTLSILAIIYTSCTTIRQIDLKKIIAYSSVAHMNFVTIGLFSNNLQGIEGSLILMLGHGLVSSALFICIGLLYDRYKTRLLIYFGGLIYIMPIYSILFFIVTLANISFPTTSNFIGEILILIGIFQINTTVAFLANIGVILGAVYAMWLYNRLIFYKLKDKFILKYCDVNRREFFILLPLIILIFIVGIYPNIILNALHSSIYLILEILYISNLF